MDMGTVQRALRRLHVYGVLPLVFALSVSGLVSVPTAAIFSSCLRGGAVTFDPSTSSLSGDNA